MHSTIAGLSSGVPTLALAYSMKTQGVFETCGQGEEVVDLRNRGNLEFIERIKSSWQNRDTTRRALADAMPGVRAQAVRQMDAIAAAIGGKTNASGGELS